MGENRPPAAVDSCFDTGGALIAAGEDVWDGVLDDGPAGACTERFADPLAAAAGRRRPFRGGVFKCALQPVTEAVTGGLYGSWVPTAADERPPGGRSSRGRLRLHPSRAGRPTP